MRVLITRPEADAIRTAKRVRALGHEPVIAPLSRIVGTGAQLPDGAFDAVVASSRHAVIALADNASESLKSTPLYCVGQATAASAREHSFSNVIAAEGNAAALIKRLRHELQPGASVLYATGSPRKSDLELDLAPDYRLTILELYRSEPEKMLPEGAKIALVSDSLTVLHLSRMHGEHFLRLSAESGVEAEARRARHLVLSQDVAEPLLAAGAHDVHIARVATLDAVLALLPPGSEGGDEKHC